MDYKWINYASFSFLLLFGKGILDRFYITFLGEGWGRLGFYIFYITFSGEGWGRLGSYSVDILYSISCTEFIRHKSSQAVRNTKVNLEY